MAILPRGLSCLHVEELIPVLFRISQRAGLWVCVLSICVEKVDIICEGYSTAASSPGLCHWDRVRVRLGAFYLGEYSVLSDYPVLPVKSAVEAGYLIIDHNFFFWSGEIKNKCLVTLLSGVYLLHEISLANSPKNVVWDCLTQCLRVVRVWTVSAQVKKLLWWASLADCKVLSLLQVCQLAPWRVCLF